MLLAAELRSKVVPESDVLGLFVRVEEGWAQDERKLSELGYEPPTKS